MDFPLYKRAPDNILSGVWISRKYKFTYSTQLSNHFMKGQFALNALF